VLSYPFFVSHFGGDPTVIGKTVRINDMVSTIVGVVQRAPHYPQRTDVFVNMVTSPHHLSATMKQGRTHRMTEVFGRLAPNATVDQARSEIRSISANVFNSHPEAYEKASRYEIAVNQLKVALNERASLTLWLLMGAAGFVLLIACANVANLFLVRAAARQHDLAVRTALGASHRHVMGELLTESIVLSVAGAALGALLASWLVQAVVAFGPRGLPRLDEVAVDGRVLAFTAIIAIITGIVVGFAPAWHAARPDIGQMLRESGRAVSRGAAHRTRSLLVVIEMALAVVLLIGAGLLLRSFVALAHVDPGFRAEHVTTFNVTLPDAKFPLDRQKNGFVAAMLDRLRQLPGTEAAAATFGRPLSRGTMRTMFEVAGRPPSTPSTRMVSDVHTASADYFKTMGVPLLRGRAFTAADDRMDARPVVVVSSEFARKYFPGEDPIGKSITLGISHDTAQPGTSVTAGGEIVGIVGDTKQQDLAEPPYPAAYIPASLLPMNDLSFIVRSTAAPSALAGGIKRELHEIDPATPLFGLQSMEDAVGESVSQPRFYTMLLGAFAGVALVLAAVGVYGVISYGVSLRARELGIRVALGATGNRIVGLVLRQGIALTVSGLALGLVTAALVTRAVTTMLFGVASLDPVTYAAVPLVLLAVAALACWIPARRASRIDPVVTMRAE
jgi:predicted permease